jgi:hypothetical protein
MAFAEQHAPGSDTVNPAARQARFSRLRQMGCICCWKLGLPGIVPEIHHLNGGGHAGQKRRGDEFTIPLCRWHHQGISGSDGMAHFRMMYGPSLKLHSRAFRAEFGTDDELLEKVNDMIDQMNGVATGHLRVTG